MSISPMRKVVDDYVQEIVNINIPKRIHIIYDLKEKLEAAAYAASDAELSMEEVVKEIGMYWGFLRKVCEAEKSKAAA